jgi:hypothetical protein
MTTYTCPVCGYADLPWPPVDEDGDGLFEICPSCGFQFGVTDDDEGFTYESWRARWIDLGMPWDPSGATPPPRDWNPAHQLEDLLRGLE